MSNSQPSVQNRRFLAAASLIIVLTAGLAASAWPAVLSYGRGQSTRLVTAGDRAKGDQARLDYQLAYLLDPRNEAAALVEAQAKQAAGEPAVALKVLKNAGKGRGVDRVRVRAALETGDTGLAIAAADRLSAVGASGEDLVLAALAYGVAGKPERIEPLKARVTAPQALQGLLRAEGSKVTLAIQLRTTGLLLSSRRILEQTEVSVPRNLLLASLMKGDGRTDDLPALAKLYQQVIAIDPTNIIARTELIAVLRAQKNPAEADSQQKLLNRLKLGQP